MNREKFRGTKDVFKFTFLQSVKAKSYRITLVILSAIAFFVLPIISLFSEDSDNNNEIEKISVDAIYVSVEGTGKLADNFINSINTHFENDKESLLSGIRFIKADKASSEFEEELKEITDESYKNLLLKVSVTEVNCMYEIIYGKNTAISSNDANTIAGILTSELPYIVARSLGVSEDKLDYISPEINENYEAIEVKPVVDENVVDENDISNEDDNNGEFTQTHYWVTYALLFVIMMFITLSGEAIATSIITEKSTRVVEYLMVSVKPMALVVGKILATLCSIGLQFAAMITAFLVSLLINGVITGDMTVALTVINSIKKTGILEHVNVINVVIALVIIVLGIIFFGLVAGVAGATVSKIEDAAEGLKMFTFLILIGVYADFALLTAFTSGGDLGAFTNVMYILPISSVFVVPVFVLMGIVEIKMALISIAALIICIVFLLLYVSKVYEYLIYHRGEPIKLKQLIKMSKNAVNN